MSLARKLARKQEHEKAKYISDIKSEAKQIARQAVDKASQRAYEEGYNDAYKKAFDEASEVALAKVLAVSAEIVYNDFGKLQKKESRLQVFVELMSQKLQHVENPTEQQLEVERLLEERCGVKFGR